MRQLLVDRLAIETALTTARRRAEGDVRGSPSWDAAMEWIDDLEQELAELYPNGSALPSPNLTPVRVRRLIWPAAIGDPSPLA